MTVYPIPLPFAGCVEIHPIIRAGVRGRLIAALAVRFFFLAAFALFFLAPVALELFPFGTGDFEPFAR